MDSPDEEHKLNVGNGRKIFFGKTIQIGKDHYRRSFLVYSLSAPIQIQ